MSTVEDKLAASLKRRPAASQATPRGTAKPGRRPDPPAAPETRIDPPRAEAPSAPGVAARPLHPRRVWPD